MLLTIYLVPVLLVALAPAAMAGYQASTGSTWGPYQTGSGGEFTFQPNTELRSALNNLDYYATEAKNVSPFSLGNPNFQTFCLERTEYIYQATTYDVALNIKAIYGSVSVGDSISVGTAWLYQNFATHGNFDGIRYDGVHPLTYNYGTGRLTSADQFQKAIWWLEDEPKYGYDSNNPFMKAALIKFDGGDSKKTVFNAKKDNWDQNGVGQYQVKVMNLWVQGHAGDGSKNPDGTYKYARQDQLVYVPEPFTLLFLGSCLVGAGIISRRFKI